MKEILIIFKKKIKKSVFDHILISDKFYKMRIWNIIELLYDTIVDNVNFKNGFLKEMDSWKKFLNCMQSFCVSE